MSSILDALKKLEEEKTRESDPTDLPLDEVIAAQELLGKRHKGGRDLQGWGTRLVVPVSLGTSFLLVCVSLFVVYVSIKNQSQGSNSSTGNAYLPLTQATIGQNTRQVAVEYGSGQAVPEKRPNIQVTQEQTEFQAPIQAAPVPDLVSKTEEPSRNVVPSPSTAPSSEPKLPSSDAVVYVRSEPVEVPSTPPVRQELPPIPKDSPREMSFVEETNPVSDPTLLPVLTPSDQERLGLPRLKVNFVSQASSQRPQPYALINYKKVYAGEIIPSTNARLIAVSVQGVGIEVGGQKFFVPAR